MASDMKTPPKTFLFIYLNYEWEIENTLEEFGLEIAEKYFAYWFLILCEFGIGFQANGMDWSLLYLENL